MHFVQKCEIKLAQISQFALNLLNLVLKITHVPLDSRFKERLLQVESHEAERWKLKLIQFSVDDSRLCYSIHHPHVFSPTFIQCQITSCLLFRQWKIPFARMKQRYSQCYVDKRGWKVCFIFKLSSPDLRTHWCDDKKGDDECLFSGYH